MIGRSHLILTRKTAQPRFSSSFFLDWYNCQFSPLKKISYFLFQNYLLFTKTNALQATLLKSSNLPVWWYATIRASETRGVLQQTSKNHPWKIGKGTCELNEHGEIGEDTELEDEQGVTFSIVQKVK